jgi:hypothetical protein
MIQLAQQAARRWALTGTPRSYQLTDVWGPAQFVTQKAAFPPFHVWRNANFFPVDQYARIWRPRSGVGAAIVERLRSFTCVVDRAALATRPPVVEIVHDVPLDASAAGVYAVLDKDGTTDWPTLVFVTFRHEIERIRERFPFAEELAADRIDAWNAGQIEMLFAHPASAGHGVNLQQGSDTLVWFSLPWSAELFQQANARLARQGQFTSCFRPAASMRSRTGWCAADCVRRTS